MYGDRSDSFSIRRETEGLLHLLRDAPVALRYGDRSDSFSIRRETEGLLHLLRDAQVALFYTLG